MMSFRGQGVRCCDGVTRREFLQLGGLGAAGLALPDLLGFRAASASHSNSGIPFGRAKRCILLFMTGGPPQMDTWDLKPDAPAAVRGEFKPIRTNVPGIEISEQFPLLARVADRYAIIRSVTHDSNIHTVGAHAMLTGNVYTKTATGEISASPSDFPHYGSVIAKLRPRLPRVPAFVALPQKQQNTDGTVWPGQGGGFLGAQYDPLQVSAEYQKYKKDARDYENCRFRTPALTLPDGMTADRFNARRRLLAEMENQVKHADESAEMGLLDQYREKAFDLLSSTESQRAFNLDDESIATRDLYGRHLFGQGCLLARRLAAAGVPLVTVYWHPDGNTTAPSWDTHEKNYENLRSHLMSPCDRAFSGLLEDLRRTGMIDDTLVVWMGEFGRTSQINPAGGRDHWGACQSIVMAGAGIRGGIVHGKSDKVGAYPIEDPVSPGDIGATIYTLLGIRPDTEIVDRTGQPHHLVRGEAIQALF